MDFQKLRSLVSHEIAIDTKHADECEIRVNYKPGDDTAWVTFTPEKYQSEEKLAEAINARADETKNH